MAEEAATPGGLNEQTWRQLKTTEHFALHKQVRVCMYLCMYACMYVYVCVCVESVYAKTTEHFALHKQVRACVCVCVWVRVCVCVEYPIL
jgi:hypothetical protein